MLKSLNNLHHAYLLVGESKAAESYLHDFFESAGMRLVGSPDYFVWKEEVFGIGEARSVNARAVAKAFGERKVFFITPARLTLPAQNALLKTFEDPTPGTHFFLVMREKELVIPTLLSRMQVISLTPENTQQVDAEKFLSLTVGERIAFTKKFVDAEKNVSAFLDSLLTELRIGNNDSKLAKVYKQRLVSDQQGASARLILEHLSLVL